VDVAALILMAVGLLMFVFAASGRELRHLNEIALGLVFVKAALICQFTAVTNTHIGH
jgi:membrane protein CcdC involved in cytochrome C biogenesis